jgi:hypothetical protein
MDRLKWKSVFLVGWGPLIFCSILLCSASSPEADPPAVKALKDYLSHKPIISKVVGVEYDLVGKTNRFSFIGAYCGDGHYLQIVPPGLDVAVEEIKPTRAPILSGRYKDESWETSGVELGKSIAPDRENPDLYALGGESSFTHLSRLIMLGSQFLEPGSAVWTGNDVIFRPSWFKRQQIEVYNKDNPTKKRDVNQLVGRISVKDGKIHRLAVKHAGCFEFEYEDSPDRPEWFPARIYYMGYPDEVDAEELLDIFDTEKMFRLQAEYLPVLHIRKLELSEEPIPAERFLPEAHVDINEMVLTVFSNSVEIITPDRTDPVFIQKTLDALGPIEKRSPLSLYLWNGMAIASLLGLVLMLFYRGRQR